MFGITIRAIHRFTLYTPVKLLSDNAVLSFGADSDVTVTHDPDDGLILKSSATGDDNPFLLTLQTGETDLAANDVIGKIQFQAPDEGTGTDAILISGAIQARAEGDHSSSSNATSLDFMTGASEAATTKATLTSAGQFNVGATTSTTGLFSVQGVSGSLGGVSNIADFARGATGGANIQVGCDTAIIQIGSGVMPIPLFTPTCYQKFQFWIGFLI